MCDKSCGCRGNQEAQKCETVLIACDKCWGNVKHPAEKKNA